MWKKADDMEHEIKVKATDRWVDDSEVTNCATCKTEFSFLVRRVGTSLLSAGCWVLRH